MPNFRISGPQRGPCTCFGQPIVFPMTSPCCRTVGGAGSGRPAGQGARLCEDPGIADRPAGNGDPIDARVGDHVQTIWAENRSPLPRIVCWPACRLTWRRNSQSLDPS